MANQVINEIGWEGVLRTGGFGRCSGNENGKEANDDVGVKLWNQSNERDRQDEIR